MPSQSSPITVQLYPQLEGNKAVFRVSMDEVLKAISPVIATLYSENELLHIDVTLEDDFSFILEVNNASQVKKSTLPL